MRALMCAAIVVASFAAVTTTSADAVAQRDMLLRPGRGIGDVDLGMTRAQVKAALGRHRTVNRTFSRGFGSRYVELDWGLGRWTVALEGRRGDLRVVGVATSVSRHRARGVGVRSRVREVSRAFPTATCFTRHLDYRSIGTFVAVAGPSRSATLFRLRGHRGYEPHDAPRPVIEVAVERHLPLPGQRDWPCPGNWRSW